MTVHLGIETDKTKNLRGEGEAIRGQCGKIIFSVKTGKQCKPEFIRYTCRDYETV